MALGIVREQRMNITRAPKRGPQSFINRLLVADVMAVTRTPRAAELAVFPGLVSRTYYGDYRPGTAQRIAPPINTGEHYATSERVRQTLVARSRYFRSVTRKGGGR